MEEHGCIGTDLAVVRESTEGGDVLDREVSLRRSRADGALLSDPVDLLVELYDNISLRKGTEAWAGM